MHRILIAGAGGHGREIFSWVADSTRWRRTHLVSEVAFLNDDVPNLPLPGPLVGTIAGYVPRTDESVICAVGDPADRRKVVGVLKSRGARMASFVHDGALIGVNVSLGEGVVVFPRVTVSCDVRIGAQVHLNLAAAVTHDVTIGEYSTLGPGAVLLGGASVGTDAYIGSGAVVLPRQSIGNKSVVGAQAMVNRAIPDGTVVAGVPAREIGRSL